MSRNHMWLAVKTARVQWSTKHRHWMQKVGPNSYVVVPEFVLIGWAMILAVCIVGLAIAVVGGLLIGG